MIVNNNPVIQSKLDHYKKKSVPLYESTYHRGHNNIAKLQQNPLNKSVSTQVNFKGFFNVKHFEISPQIYKKAIEILNLDSENTAKQFQKAVKNFTQEVIANPKFSKKLHYTQEEVAKLTEGTLLSLPQKSLPHRLANAIVEPIQKIGKKLFSSQEVKKQNKIISDYAEANGLLQSVQKWENKYRQRYGVEAFKEGEKFLIPDELLQGNLRRRGFEGVDISKGHYNAKSLSVGNRIVTGIIGAFMYGTDAYNTTMRLSDSKSESSKEGKIKFAQQIIRISLSAYFTSIALGVFQNKTNRSIKNALGVSLSMALLSEILGRKLVGKPILPTNKAKMQEKEKKNETSKNPFLKIEKKIKSKKTNEPQTPKISDPKPISTVPSGNLPSLSFGKSSAASNLTFGKKLPKMFSAQEVSKLLDFIEVIDPKKAEYIEDIIKKGLKNAKELDLTKPLREILSSQKEIPIGSFEPTSSKAKDAFLLPVKSVKNLIKFIKTKTASDTIAANTKRLKDSGLWETYEQELKKIKASDIWQMPSKKTEEQKINALMKQVLHIYGEAQSKEIGGVQNTLLWVEKELLQNKKEFSSNNVEEIIDNILKNKEEPKYKEFVDGFKDKFAKKFLAPCARDKADYDTSLYSTANLFLARLITTAFLVGDTYNLTMLHSNDNKEKAKQNGAEYAAQEISRTFFTTYLVGITNTLFKAFHNASLFGALTLTALTNSTVQFLSRFSVGKPVSPKSHDELIKMEEDPARKNNPVLKVIAKAFGKNTKKIDYGEKSSKDTSIANNPALKNHINFTNRNTFKDFIPNIQVNKQDS